MLNNNYKLKLFQSKLFQIKIKSKDKLFYVLNYNKNRDNYNKLKHCENSPQSSPQNSPQSETFTAKSKTQMQGTEKSCKLSKNGPHLKEYKEIKRK